MRPKMRPRMRPCVPDCSEVDGAESETRTRDLSFTKALLYQLSYLGQRLGEGRF